MHVTTRSAFGKDEPVKHEPPQLYNLAVDPSEKADVGARHPQVIAELKKLLAEHEATVTPVENQLEKDYTGK
jgi:arylsulfatase